jgi:site-specific DNA-adenine methylase
MLHSSFLNYTGNKDKLFPLISPYFPKDINILVEPFVGSGVISFNTRANSYRFNDFFKPTFSVYKYIMSNSIEVIMKDISNVINTYGLSKVNDVGYNRFILDKDLFDYGLYIYVGLCFAFCNYIRVNDAGFLSKGIGDRDFNYNLRRKLEFTKDWLDKKDVRVSNLSFNDLDYDSLSKGDFVYLDPPYLVSNAEYNKYWSVDYEKDLYFLINNLDENGIIFGLSNILNKGDVVNSYLEDFINSNDFKVFYFSDDLYVNCSPEKFLNNTNSLSMQEVYVTNNPNIKVKNSVQSDLLRWF